MTARDTYLTLGAADVRAVLAGQKVQHRWAIKLPEPPAMDAIHPGNVARHPRPYFDADCTRRPTPENPRGMSRSWHWWTRDDRGSLPTVAVGYAPGDHVLVRETWAAVWPGEEEVDLRQCTIEYRADLPEGCTDYPGQWPAEDARGNWEAPKWRSANCMPRWASRLTLVVTDVRVERLHDMMLADAEAMGFLPPPSSGSLEPLCGSIERMAAAWDARHHRGSWRLNPWVVALTFRAERRNIDAAPAAAPAREAAA